MAKVLGRLRKVYIGANEGSATTIGNLTDSTWNGSRAEVSTTDADSGDSEEYQPGRMSSTLDISARYNEASTSQGALIAAYFSGAEVFVKWVADTGSGMRKLTGKAIVTSCNIPSPDGDTTNLTATLRITGAVTPGTQSD
jgi:hypothetical protein